MYLEEAARVNNRATLKKTLDSYMDRKSLEGMGLLQRDMDQNQANGTNSAWNLACMDTLDKGTLPMLYNSGCLVSYITNGTAEIFR